MRIVLLVADGLQATAIGAYGNEWIETPHLNELAGAGVVFDNHFADSPSREIPGSIARFRHAFPGTPRKLTNWLDLLGERGIECEWLAAKRNAAGRDQIADGLKRWARKSEGVLCIQIGDLLPPWEVADEMLEAAFDDWHHDVDPEPVLDPRPGLIDPEDDFFRESLQRTYNALVRQFDSQVGTLVEQISRDDVLIVTAGYGQNLGEHGLVGDHLPWLHEELIHFPLLVRLPNGAQGGRRVDQLTQSIDIGPTVFHLLESAIPPDCHGKSLMPLCQSRSKIRDYICCGRQIGDRAEFALQTTDEKIIVPQGDPNRRPMYFVKPDDRCDVSDLRQAHQERAETLESLLVEYVAASAKPGPLHPPCLPHSENFHGNREAR